MEYREGSWQDPRIESLRSFDLHPAAIVFHYGQAIFEGLKAFRHADGKIVLFRPEMNADRLNRSAGRLDMPAIDAGFFLEAASALVDHESSFVPPAPGSLYLRPTMIGIEPCIGVKSANEFLFYILALPAGSYFKEVIDNAGSIRVLISESSTRAARGGTGNVKAAGNYAASLKITSLAKSLGCAQVLFLDAVERSYVEEMGGMNIFFVKNDTLITPSLSDTILAGITRDTILHLARDFGIPVQEEPVHIGDVISGIQSGTITEALACGTAASVTGIGAFQFEDGHAISVGYTCPGPLTNMLFDRIRSIQFGEFPDDHRWLFQVRALEAVEKP